MQVLLGACLLWALFSTGSSLKCNLCLNLTGPCLDSDLVDCDPDEDACFDSFMEVSVFGNFRVNIKGCTTSTECVPGKYSTTTEENQGMQQVVTCCYADHCNSATSKLPKNSNVLPNGLLCPACYNLGTEDCKPEEMVFCTGEETMCLFIVGYMDLTGTSIPIKSNGALKGCTTPNTCQSLEENANEIDNPEVSFNVTHAECTNALRAAKNAINKRLPNRAPLPGK